MDETAHVGGPRSVEPNSPAKGDSDLPQPPRSASEPPAGDASPQTAPSFAEPAAGPAEPAPAPPVEAASVEPIAAAPGLPAEAEPQDTPAAPQPLTALPEAGEADVAEAGETAPAESAVPLGNEPRDAVPAPGVAADGNLPVEPAAEPPQAVEDFLAAVARETLSAAPALRQEEVRQETPQLQREAAAAIEPSRALPEPAHHEPFPPESQPIAAGVPEVRVQQAAQAVPTTATVAWSPPISAAPVPPPEPSQRLTPAWLPRQLPVADAARERLPDLRRAIPYLRIALRGVAVLATGLVVTVLTLVVLYRWINPPLSTLMLSQSLVGTEIERRWVPLQRISPHLIKAVVLSEDGGFCRHSGVDWTAIEEALEADRGGSTITMQVVKNLFLWPSRSYVRKVIEIGLAYLVDALWPKQRILEIYLNIAEWGDGVFGAEAAARAHFNKPASRLTAEEAALLAVALPNPLERMPGAPSLATGRLASRLLLRMRTSRADFSCVPLPRTVPGKAPLVPGPRLTL